jgi:PilZ domain
MQIPLQIDKRRIPRVPGTTVGPLRILTADPGPACTAQVRDVSIQGIGLLVDQPIETGTPLVVGAGPSGKPMRTELKMQVCHATRQTDGKWLLGCQFARYLTADDFLVLA